MKVKIAFTVDIDAQAWEREFGVTLDDVRRDVRVHAENLLRNYLIELGLGES